MCPLAPQRPDLAAIRTMGLGWPTRRRAAKARARLCRRCRCALAPPPSTPPRPSTSPARALPDLASGFGFLDRDLPGAAQLDAIVERTGDQDRLDGVAQSAHLVGKARLQVLETAEGLDAGQMLGSHAM